MLFTPVFLRWIFSCLAKINFCSTLHNTFYFSSFFHPLLFEKRNRPRNPKMICTFPSASIPCVWYQCYAWDGTKKEKKTDWAKGEQNRFTERRFSSPLQVQREKREENISSLMHASELGSVQKNTRNWGHVRINARRRKQTSRVKILYLFLWLDCKNRPMLYVKAQASWFKSGKILKLN